VAKLSVLVLGAGFGGLEVAARLSDSAAAGPARIAHWFGT
jgi:NADH dehydrogenase FAD-containing subunit